MSTFVLVHGAFRGGWSFMRLRQRLWDAGQRVWTPTLPGSGELAECAPARVDLDVCAHAVARLIELEDLREVVLVGHSQGGLIIQAVSQWVPDRLSRLIFLDAPEPRHGERALDLVPPALAAAPRPDIPEDLVLPARPVEAGPHMSSDDAAFMNARLTPTHAAIAFTPLQLDDPRALALPRHHVFFRHTPDVFPCAHARARCEAEGIAYRWVDAGHDAPFTHPGEVSRCLLELSEGR